MNPINGYYPAGTSPKTDFILALPMDMPAKQVVAEARKQGLTIMIRMVERTRSWWEEVLADDGDPPQREEVSSWFVEEPPGYDG